MTEDSLSSEKEGKQWSFLKDEAARRQWESSIGIKHPSSRKFLSLPASSSFVSSSSSDSCSREFINPLKELPEERNRASSPLLSLDEDRVNIDEYADVAGHFFADALPTRPSRSRRGKARKIPQLSRSKLSSSSQQAETFYATPSRLPMLKGSKCRQPAKMEENDVVICHNIPKKKESKGAVHSEAFDRKYLIDDRISPPFARFDHTEYAMLPACLFKLEGLVESDQLDSNAGAPCADMSIPYDASLANLRKTIINIVFGNQISQSKRSKAQSKLRLMAFECRHKRWLHLPSESQWTHVKLVTQESSQTLRILYYFLNQSNRMDFSDGGSVATNSTLASASSHKKALENQQCSMQILKTDMEAAASSASTVPFQNDSSMVNILESRLMRSRY